MKTKTMNSKWTAVLTGLLALAILAGASACNHQGPEKRAEFVTSRISSALDLNKDNAPLYRV